MEIAIVSRFGNGYLCSPEELEIDGDGFVYVTSHESQSASIFIRNLLWVRIVHTC